MMNDRPSANAQTRGSKFWLKSYPRGTPSEIDASQLSTLKEMCELACTRYADSPALIQGEQTLSFTQLEMLSRSFGAWLQSVGARKGDRVALMLPNILEFPIAIFGALRVGMTVVCLNPMYTSMEIQHLINDGQPVVIVTLNALRPMIEAFGNCATLRYIVTVGGGEVSASEPPSGERCRCLPWTQAVRASPETSLKSERVEPDDLALIQYTGGTTGSPKGVMLTHRNLCANILQSVALIRPYADGQRILITLLPLYHIFALAGSLFLFVHLGWCNVLIPDARNFSVVIAELARYPIAYLSGVNTLFRGLLHALGFNALDFSHLKITLSGGMATEPQVANRWYEVTGCPITQAWGLTEASPGATSNFPGMEFNGSVGLPLPSTEIAIKDEVGGSLPLGEVGEICVRGPQVMRGYWQRPMDTSQAFWPGAWLRTGDAGHFDDQGFVHLTERLKDVIVVSGFKVYPLEVEAAAATYPGVLEAAATAQRDGSSSESVALFVVCAGESIDEATLIQHCRQTLAPYKVPKRVYVRTALPKSSVGKVLRKALREELMRPPLE
ncbi:MAG: AMP-binding protein [Proteobacteria bacterium]|nr:AMP-binding protein [Pseudomonadota bacterium]